ncbi:MAG TPA: protein-L-isoaspartate(D-aspartate) O-methyltransferase [Candidatus Polarisedimenticolia bacterium]|nr:protein-L-isoaspartate(D-aspartate) O-methyltransferase [Candidatus Polarisedimenticolia bacterium]
MVEEQLRKRGIHDPRVLRIMAAVPRHLFVDPTFVGRAYSDHALPIGQEQTISQPYMVALMTQALGLEGEEKVLEIGTGSGYQTAMLAELADRVFTIERIPEIGIAARERLTAMGYSNIIFRIGDGTVGWREMSPFDRVIVTAGAPQVPPFLEEQLRVGGWGIVPVGDASNQSLVRVTRTESGAQEEVLCSCTFVPLIGKEGWAAQEPKE